MPSEHPVELPLRELRFSYSRSSGPGGQNVNKVSTRATLHWAVARSAALPPDMRERFVARFGRRISRAGELQLSSQRFRDQGRNTADCLERLRAMLLEVATPPRRRRKTRPGRGAVERRLTAKRHLSERKSSRRSPPD